MQLKLRDLRVDNDLLQKQLADYLNCTQQTYSRYENGQSEPSLAIMEKLARYYETSVDYLMGLTNVKTPYPKLK